MNTERLLQAGQAVEAAQPTRWQAGGPVLLRLAAQGGRALGGLRMPQSLALLARIEQESARLAELRTRVCDDILYRAAGACSGPDKSALVALKRKLFKQQAPKPAELQALAAIAGLRDRRLVRAYVLRLARLAGLQSQAQQVFANELLGRREQLRGLFSATDFCLALQLSSPTLARNAQALAGKAVADWRKAERQTESTLLRYYARSVAKTSPFGRWGLVAMGYFAAEGAAPAGLALRLGPQGLAVQHKSNLNLALCAQIARSLSERAEIAARLPLALNPTRFLDGPDLCFFAPASACQGAPYSVLRRGLLQPAMANIIAALQDQPPLPGRSGVLDCLLQHPALAGLGRAKLTSWVDGLLRSGLLQVEALMASDQMNALSSLAASLRQLLGEAATELCEPLLELERLGQGFAAQDVAGRAASSARITALCQALGVVPQPKQPLVIEDSYDTSLRLSLGPQAAQRLNEDLGLWLDAVVDRDQDGLGLQMMKDIFVHSYGAGGVCQQLYHFAAQCLKACAQAGPKSGPEFPRAQRMQAARGRFMRALARLSRASAADVQLDGAGLRRLLSEAGVRPAAAGLRSAAVHLQVLARDAGALARGDCDYVLNQALPGFGRFFSRYSQLFVGSDWHGQLCEQVQRLQRSSGLEVLELQATHAHNAQVHPPLSARALLMPGERSARAGLLQPAALTLHHDAATDSLHFSHAGVEVLPLYMGFFHNMALPPAHRVLVDALPYAYQAEELRPIDHLERQALRDAAHDLPVRAYARIRLGRLILQRRSWAIDCSALPELAPAASDFECFKAYQDWRRLHDLPARAFWRVGRRKAAALPSDHKPIFVDLDNHLLLRSFLAGLDLARVDSLILEEALPDALADGPDLGSGPQAIELQLQLWQEASA